MKLTFLFFITTLCLTLISPVSRAEINTPLNWRLTNYTTEIKQNGIKWYFDSPVEYGEFVNGDYWILDPGKGVKVIQITPGYMQHPETGRDMNGSMLNPVGQWQGYDAANSYDASKNVGIGISEETPLILTANNSLVTTISNPDGIVDNSSYIKTAAVLTCLSTAPPSGTFRPGIGSTIKHLHNKNDLNLSLLKKLDVPETHQTIITPSYLDEIAARFQMVWIDHNGRWSGRYLHPIDSGLDNYYFAPYFAVTPLLLNLNFTDSEKETLLINYVQLGIDLYSFVEAGLAGWWPDGGHGPGRKLPILFAGLMLNDDSMKNIGQISGDYLYAGGYGPGNVPPGYIRFGEDSQTFYVKQFDVDITNGPAWNPDTRAAPNYPYTTTMIGMPEWGIKYDDVPEASDSQWTTKYRTNRNNTPYFAGATLVAKIMGIQDLWNHQALFDYTDRYMAISGGDPDPFGYTVANEGAALRPSGFIGAMWDKYRSTLQ